MRRLFPIALLALLLAGCADYIPVKHGFGTSALRRSGKTPPEYARFNSYDPAVNALLASQMCATPYVLLEQKTHPAAPGELITWRGSCQPYDLTLPNRLPLIAWRPPAAPWPPAPVPPPAAAPAPRPLVSLWRPPSG